MAAKTLMIQGTASHVGKSTIVAGLCRLFLRMGYRVAPFKAQNMSNNAAVTPDGREIGRAQAVQAAACRLDLRTDFNPVLIKPEADATAQLVIDGAVAGRLAASDFGRLRQECTHPVRAAFQRLAAEFDVVVLEGAGSPAEINLRSQELVNMWMAREARAPVILVGDIDRGGVFAALVGTWALLDVEERRHIKALAINKFRGEERLLAPGIEHIVAAMGVPCLGVIPYWNDVRLPDEDSVGWRERMQKAASGRVTIGVADLPALSNATDFESWGDDPDVRLTSVSGESDAPLDVLIFPGTKCTVAALDFVRRTGLDRLAERVRRDGGLVIGICGGYQLLGHSIADPHGVESAVRETKGLGWLDVATTFETPKTVRTVTGRHRASGADIQGYEIHMGAIAAGDAAQPLFDVRAAGGGRRPEGAVSVDGRVLGTSVHGVFDSAAFRRWIVGHVSRSGGAAAGTAAGETLDRRLDRLADRLAAHLDMAHVLRILEAGV